MYCCLNEDHFSSRFSLVSLSSLMLESSCFSVSPLAPKTAFLHKEKNAIDKRSRVIKNLFIRFIKKLKSLEVK